MILQVDPVHFDLQIWMIVAALALPTTLVGVMTLFGRNKKFIRGETVAMVNEMLVAGDLPTASAQAEMRTVMTEGFKRVTDLERKIENGMIAKMDEMKRNQKATDTKLDALDSKVDRLIGHLDA